MLIRHQLMHVRLKLQVLHYLFALAGLALYYPVLLPRVTLLKKKSLVISKAEHLFMNNSFS